MKSTGVIRRVDELGRIVIPMELRKNFDIKEKDPLEIFVEGEQIMLRKYQVGCLFCGESKDIQSYKGKHICKDCIEEMKGI
jgi:transcriptional pleiotropic regulator of transition state genes